ncbi:MAG: bifunctional [glutamate--ammonia ligase]-adenylyl-L-tyrosine phosphorylase/[glutamate--ammonia-ligase] adenylyltransferase [Methylohalobius sp.]|nr:bifunctional [glutamate--ammonia ligase]-adenylyl-L-tyrosine phosphorylase/[glutamate--ammonia-ligase] adenylyltransferase [Methylohalobius sp.]
MAKPDFFSLPSPLRSAAEQGWQQYLENGGISPFDEQILASVPRVFAVSRFVVEQCIRRPKMLEELVTSGDLLAPTREYWRELSALVKEAAEMAELQKILRRFRNREMVRIAWRDIAGWASLDDTLRDLSSLAEACLQAALAWLFERACLRFGTPYRPDGQPQLPVVLAMGKLGGGELNFSSDIDLIFAFEHDGVLADRRGTRYQEFYHRLGQDLIKALQALTEDGFAFRVDTRLRPFGDSGPLVWSFDAMDIYYQSQGRDWERYALIKARPVAGDLEAGARLLKSLQPFVYRRYLDYGALAALRELKRKIMEELRRRDRLDDIKLGPGGIREIEFIAQVFQLIRGGQEAVLRERRLLVTLAHLKELGLLPAEEADALVSSYRFLRQVENRLQQYADEQTQRLPQDEVGRLRLAVGMGAPSWEVFQTQLDKVRCTVQTLFEQVFALPQEGGGKILGAEVWHGTEEARSLDLLAQMGYGDPKTGWERLRAFRHSRTIRMLTPKALAELDRLMPSLLERAGQSPCPDKALPRLLNLLEAIASRSVYLTLLAENPGALQQLIKLVAASPWIAGQLARFPLLLDELIDPRTLYAPLTRQLLETDLEQRLKGLELSDDEAVFNALRHFKQAQVLRVAAADIASAIPTRVVSDYLTAIAEVVLETALRLAWWQVAAKFGLPPGADAEAVRDFAIIGYGKLGGIELGYGSDLDLVFVYRGEAEAETVGSRSIPLAQFFARVGQRLIHILTAPMLSGVLYSIDMRLRPSGNAGLLVTSLAAFERYQLESAWTWEHQALVKARPVAGDPDLGRAFAQMRLAILCRKRDLAALRREVKEMRDKMRFHLDRSDAAQFDLKHGLGGVVDVEFIVQFGCLAHAYRCPQAFRYTDTLRLLDALAEVGWLERSEAHFLQDAYLEFRTCLHRLALEDRPGLIAQGEFRQERAEVIRLWRRLIEEPRGET